MDTRTLEDSDPPARDPGDSLSLGGRRRLAGVLARVAGTDAGTESFGRYEIGRLLGAGAFGEVYEAFDHKLRRRVALKLLRGFASGAQIERLRREARAMAAIDDPGLVKVFEVGQAAGRDYIAMELVRGSTLAEWARAHPPGTRERFEQALRLLVAAGRGLASAHARGIVHRDFKPANVLVGDDGSVKVADFGLARDSPAEWLDSSDDHLPEIDALADARAPTLTRTGAIVGTPRYMAPEQHDGLRADARSDQFAFAVAVWEVVHGEPPFSARSAVELREAIARVRLDAPRVGGVPGWIVPVLRRALAERPSDRHPSIEALLQALAGARTIHRRRGWLAGGAAVLVVVAAMMPTDPGPRCDRATAASEAAGVLDSARRGRVASALRATGVPYHEVALDGINAGLREYRDRWVAEYVSACRATWHEGTASESMLDRRVACLREDLTTVDAVVDRFESASSTLAERAIATVDELPDPTRCESPDAALAHEDATLAQGLRERLAAARAASLAAEYAAAIERAEAIVDEARAAGLEALRGEALEVIGLARNELAAGAGIGILEEAHAIAIAHDRPLRAAETAQHVAIASSRVGDLDSAERWLRHADAALARVTTSPRETVARGQRAHCNVLDAQGRFGEALAQCRAAIATLESEPGFDPSLAWTMRMSAANVLVAMGELAEAEPMLVRLRDDAIARLGDHHPKVGGASMNLGSAVDTAGHAARAIEHYRAALAVFRAAYGPEHAWVVSALMNIGTAEAKLGELERAEATLGEALAIVGESRDARAARVMFNLADVRRRQRRFEDVLTLVDRVADIESETLPAGHIQTAHTHHLRGLAYLELGRLAQARAEIERVLALRSASPRTREVATAHTVLARIAAAQGHIDEAITAAEHAERIYEETAAPAGDRAANLSRLADWQLERQRRTPR